MSKVPLDRHRILMLKNKIYNYLLQEIFKNFITILLTFTTIVWAVRSVNFLDIMIDDGYSAGVYFKYSALNIFSIISRFIPLSFLLSLIISIIKFEQQQELMILWTIGIKKIKIVYILFLIGVSVAIIQVVLGVFINPYTLNKSRSILRETDDKQINSIIKTGDFSDAIKSVTFYIEKKNEKKELINVFIKDKNGSLNTIVNEVGSTNDVTIFAKKGFIVKNKIILFDGTIQSLNKKNEIKNVDFKKNELSLNEFNTRAITQTKIQETSSYDLIRCIVKKKLDNFNKICPFNRNKKIIAEHLSRRIGMPLYVPLISLITSFLLINYKKKKYNIAKKYIIFAVSFSVLISAEVLVRFSGFSFLNSLIYFLSPFFLSAILFFLLSKEMMSERA